VNLTVDETRGIVSYVKLTLFFFYLQVSFVGKKVIKEFKGHGTFVGRALSCLVFVHLV
jgi:hypothetical protein